MPALAEDITKTAKDALYITVGLGVIAFQKAQVQRQDIVKLAREAVKEAQSQLESLTGRTGTAA
jgi:hypothetical protein